MCGWISSARYTVAVSGVGDRRDNDLHALTRILGSAFDNVRLYEDACQYGRTDGEVTALLREGLAGTSRVSLVEEILGELVTIDCALSLLEPDDPCLALLDQVRQALHHLAHRAAEG